MIKDIINKYKENYKMPKVCARAGVSIGSFNTYNKYGKGLSQASLERILKSMIIIKDFNDEHFDTYKEFYNMKKICEIANISYDTYKNSLRNGYLSKDKRLQLMKAMKSVEPKI